MYTLYTTMLINLKKDENELRNQINKSLRTEVRKAIKSNVEVVVDYTDSDINDAYDLYLAMMKKKRIPVEKSYKLWNSEKTKFICAKYEGKVISYIQFQLFSPIDVWNKTKICALETIANADEFKNLCANSLLYWEWIKMVKNMWFEYLNFNWVDYEGWGDFNSLAHFKRKRNWIEIVCVSKKWRLSYIYRKYFRKFKIVQKFVYRLLTNILSDKYLKY